MIGIVLIYWIGKNYYTLARTNNKSEWGFAILGVVSYYGGILLSGLIFGIVSEIIAPGFIDTQNETMLGLLMVPFGVLTCYLLYKYLEKTWKGNYRDPLDLIE